MQTYQPKSDHLAVSRIAYGCMGLGGPWDAAAYSNEEKKTSFAAIEVALAEGINCFDHADIYTRGKAESVFGEFLRDHPSVRDQMVIQSKCGIRFAGEPNVNAPGRYDFSRHHIIQSTEDILRRLGLQQIDVLLLHRPDCLVEPEEVAAAFDSLLDAGKVRQFGVSNHTPAQIELLKRTLRQPLMANQVELSLSHHGLVSDGILANRVEPHVFQAVSGTLDYCRLHDLRIQAWSPLGGGRLFRSDTDLNAVELKLCKQIRGLANVYDCAPAAIAVAWLLRHPTGIQPIIGSTNPDHIAAACQADSITLSREEWYGLLTAALGTAVP